MTSNILIQLGFYLVVLLVLAKPLGEFFARVLSGERHFLSPALGWLERLTYKASGVDPQREMRWTEYAVAVLLFNFFGLLAVYALQRFQGMLPLNPAELGAVSPDSSWNTAVSFATNTNWQGYGGESTMSYLTQMLALAVQNFVSAATGIAVLAALIRGFARKQTGTIGNFWADLTRSTLYILLPLSFILALALVSQGVVQTFGPYVKAQTVEKIDYEEAKKGPTTSRSWTRTASRSWRRSPRRSRSCRSVRRPRRSRSSSSARTAAASSTSTRRTRSRTPTPLSNFLELLSILLIGAALCITFGRMVGDVRQGWAIIAAMTIIFVGLLAVATVAEQSGNPILAQAGADMQASAASSGGNMEGKEIRFGIANSALWATATTSASNGSVNSMHDSFTPLGGLVPMWLMQLGEVIFGGVGSGLYGMIMMIAGRRLRRRADDRSHARVPRQEGRGVRSQDGLGRDPAAAARRAGRHRDRGARRAGQGRRGQSGRARLLRDPLRVLVGRQQQRQRLRRAVGQHALLQHGARLRDADLALLADRPGARHRRFASRRRRPSPPDRAPCRRTRRSSSCCIIGTVLLVGALTFVPALALGPIVEHFQMLAAK